jgi:hypothetical protein
MGGSWKGHDGRWALAWQLVHTFCGVVDSISSMGMSAVTYRINLAGTSDLIGALPALAVRGMLIELELEGSEKLIVVAI